MDKKKYPIKEPFDLLLAKIQKEKEVADLKLEEIRSEDSYYKEKTALKLIDLLEKEESLVKVLIDIKENLPEMAEVLEQQKPYLKAIFEQAEEEWRIYKQSKEDP